MASQKNYSAMSGVEEIDQVKPIREITRMTTKKFFVRFRGSLCLSRLTNIAISTISISGDKRTSSLSPGLAAVFVRHRTAPANSDGVPRNY
jgi:hypothetical protein